MEAELAKLRLQLQQEQRLREEEQQRGEEEQRLRVEAEGRLSTEQRRREEAEQLSKAAQPQTFQQYLEACHSLDTAIQVVTDRSSTTQGDTTNPTGRIYPRRIVPSQDFVAKQLEVWDLLSAGDSFLSDSIFLSSHQLNYVQSLLKPISSEASLCDFKCDIVENAV